MTFMINGGAMTMSGTGGGMGGGLNYSDGSGVYPFSIQVK
jgi:hypothetical protein